MTKPFLKILTPSIIKNFVAIYRLAIIVVILAGTVLIASSIGQRQKEIENSLINSSHQIRKIVNYDIDYVKYQLFYASSQISLMNGNKYKIRKLLSTFLTNVNSQVDVALTWNAFSWIDKYGKITIDGTSGILTKPIDVAGRDYLKFTPDNYNRIIFGKPVYGALSQRFLIPAGLGTFSPKGDYIGTLVFGFDIEKVVSKVERTIANKNISFAFLREGDFVFASENFDNKNLDLTKDRIKLAALDDNIDKGTITKQSVVFNNDVTSYFQRIKGYPLEFVMFYDRDAFHKEMIDILFRQIVLIFSILVSCMILFRTVYRKIVKPVSQLSTFAQKIAQHDFTFEMKDPESKELSDLYSALQMLKDSLQREEFLGNQLRTANQKIAQENFNKSEFLSAISHDIRNPLAAIISFTSLLKNNESDNVEDSLCEIETCAHEALQFINDLMDVTQASSGVFSINMSQKINIHEMIKRSIRINRDFASKKHIKIVNHTPNNIAPINLDQRRIKQILINLINNSIKYSRKNTTIELSASNFSENGVNKLRISIKDEGIGMSDEQLAKAMVKFGLAEENTERLDSFGLGLSLVKQLVELQNGTIEIRSQIGVGTTIVLNFNYQE